MSENILGNFKNWRYQRPIIAFGVRFLVSTDQMFESCRSKELKDESEDLTLETHHMIRPIIDA